MKGAETRRCGRAGRKVERILPGLAPGRWFESTPTRLASIEKEVIMEERYYDLVFIVRPATPEEEIKKILTVIEHTCAEKGGKIEKAEHCGRGKLADRVANRREG